MTVYLSEVRIERLPPSDWLVGIWVGHILLWVMPPWTDCTIKQAEQVMKTKTLGNSILPWSLIQFLPSGSSQSLLPWLPYVMDNNSRLLKLLLTSSTTEKRLEQAHYSIYKYNTSNYTLKTYLHLSTYRKKKKKKERKEPSHGQCPFHALSTSAHMLYAGQL